MFGTTYKSEKCEYTDKVSGALVTQLTSHADNLHFYFTDNSFLTGDDEILFLSNRGASHESVFNFYIMDIHSGAFRCVSNETSQKPGTYTKTPEGDIVVYVRGVEIVRLDTHTGRTQTIYRAGEPCEIKSISISCDKKYVIFLENEDVNIESGQPNYAGFLDKHFAVKRSTIRLVGIDGGKAETVFHDTHYTGHIQFSPHIPYIATYCHEGPWNLVAQRIWVLNLLTRRVVPCMRQGKDDCVGHEFWTADGRIFFENRRAGHDGTITENKTQAFAQAPEDAPPPYIGFADVCGNVLHAVDIPTYCNHYHANPDCTLLVGDAAEDIMLIDISRKHANAKTLCHHGTSWRTQASHPHPTFSWRGKKILFGSNISGHSNLYLVEVE